MSRPQVLVNVPPPSFRRTTVTMNGRSANEPQYKLTCDKALQFTPITTSVLRPSDCIPVPEVSRVRENGRVASTLERKQASSLLSQQNPLAYTNEVANAINQSHDANLYGSMPSLGVLNIL
ncbi:hypothetical protein ES702_03216 [subsurface metagenome]